jgi:hypothetical protein
MDASLNNSGGSRLARMAAMTLFAAAAGLMVVSLTSANGPPTMASPSVEGPLN